MREDGKETKTYTEDTEIAEVTEKRKARVRRLKTPFRRMAFPGNPRRARHGVPLRERTALGGGRDVATILPRSLHSAIRRAESARKKQPVRYGPSFGGQAG